MNEHRRFVGQRADAPNRPPENRRGAPSEVADNEARTETGTHSLVGKLNHYPVLRYAARFAEEECMNREHNNWSDIEMMAALDSQYRKVRVWIEEHPVQDDLMAHQVVLNARPYLTPAYELLEQSLKALAKICDETYTSGEMRKHSHNLQRVFDRLPQKEAGYLRRGYKAFRSLHDYISYATLDIFIESIGGDYAKWRYFPLEGWRNGEPAITDPYAMLEVVGHTIDVIRAYTATDHGLQTVDKRIFFKIGRTLTNPGISANVAASANTTDLLNDWVRTHDNLINAFSVTIRRQVRDGIALADLMPQGIVPRTESAIRRVKDSKNHDMRQFCYRAIEDPHPLLWNQQRQVFSNRPPPT